jgi:hypothetical protein
MLLRRRDTRGNGFPVAFTVLFFVFLFFFVFFIVFAIIVLVFFAIALMPPREGRDFLRGPQ